MMTYKEQDLQLSSYDYDLPHELIASRPAKFRDKSRLLVYEQATGAITHTHFDQLAEFLPHSSTLVVNESKVFPCRLFGSKPTGGKVEVFVLDPQQANRVPCLVKSSGKKKVGDQFLLEGELSAQIVEINSESGEFFLHFESSDLLRDLNRLAKIPIPPYIRDGRSDEKDKADYQTVYAKTEGSVAAPTAGLHFTDSVFQSLANKGIGRESVTLHVGLGTFAPVKTDNLSEHKMHRERFFIHPETGKVLAQNWRNLIAVGTTSLRTLESCVDTAKNFDLSKTGSWQETEIFLHPGKEVYSIAGLITNFHLPKSTLLMLVSSLIGREKTLELYKLAIENKYRFFSYGDAMLILRDPKTIKNQKESL